MTDSMCIYVPTQAQITRAYALAKAHNHRWAYCREAAPVNQNLGQIAQDTERLDPVREDWQRGIPAPVAEAVIGGVCLSHRTTTGRTCWWIVDGGLVIVEITRPTCARRRDHEAGCPLDCHADEAQRDPCRQWEESVVVLHAVIPPDGGPVVEVRGEPYCQRHVLALQKCLTALGHPGATDELMKATV